MLHIQGTQFSVQMHIRLGLCPSALFITVKQSFKQWKSINTVLRSLIDNSRFHSIEKAKAVCFTLIHELHLLPLDFRFEGSPRLVLVADLDCTLVDHDDPDNTDLLKFNALWEAHFRHDSMLIYCTGRSLSSYLSLRDKRPLLTPDIAVTSVGSEIVYGSGDSMVSDQVWAARLDNNWNRDIVLEETNKFPKLELQPAKSQEKYKVSFFVDREDATEIMKVLPGILEERGVDVKLVYSNGYAFDVLPRGAGKQGAMTYLLDKLESEDKKPSNILVCGDSGNDAELFNIPQVYGVMVSNSHEELLQWREENAKDNPNIIHASERCAAGIIEAIQRFNLG